MVEAKRNGTAASWPRAETAWFALRTASRHEKQVHARLSARGVETFLPLWERWSRWKDRRIKTQVPHFPGHCFARFALAGRAPVITKVGVVCILGSARGPEPFDAREIESLKTLVQSRLEYDPHPGLAAGMEVQVVRGPLTGVRGILIRKEARCRLVISVNVIRQGGKLDTCDPLAGVATRLGQLSKG
jgi:transcription antitermination factor NusG